MFRVCKNMPNVAAEYLSMWFAEYFEAEAKYQRNRRLFKVYSTEMLRYHPETVNCFVCKTAWRCDS